mgnify:CR=1 FL=1
MWTNKTSIHGTSYGLLRKIQQCAARRGDIATTIQASLEISDSGFSHLAVGYMKTICLEDKFPTGQMLIKHIDQMETKIKKMDFKDQEETVALLSKQVASLTSDRHVSWLAKVALYNVTHNLEGECLETKFATQIEKIIVCMARKNERPTPKDITESEGFDMIEQKLGKKNSHAKLLWKLFLQSWKNTGTVSSRLYLYTLVANQFHSCSKPVETKLDKTDLVRAKLSIPDYAMEEEEIDGKKRKRGMDHYLAETVKIKNPSNGRKKRLRVETKARHIFKNEETKFGASDINDRLRARDTMNTLETLRGEAVQKLQPMRVPYGNKPQSWIVTVESGRYFVKGPVNDSENFFQALVDVEKIRYGLKTMNVEVVKEGELFYYVCPLFDGKMVDSTDDYSEDTVWEIVKALIFRHAFNISDTHLKNILVNEKGVVVSVDEMYDNRAPAKANDVLSYLFSNGKTPNRQFCLMLKQVIRKRKKQFVDECEKYNGKADKLKIASI